jgi:hypothetical protein
MRLYEFTDPTKYLFPETDAADLAKQRNNRKAADNIACANGHLRKKPDTKEPTETL